MVFEVKLDAYVLPDDHTVYKFFPGENYKFYDVIRDNSIAFMDVRGLEDVLGGGKKWDDRAVLSAISADRVRRLEENGKDKPDKIINSSGDKLNLGFLKGLLKTAKRGDLLLMPQRGYTTNVLIGQLLDDPLHLHQFDARDDGATRTYLGRRVKWVGAIEKRLFKTELIEKLQTPVAFFDVGKSNYEQVYRLAFDNFVYDNQFVGTFRTSKQIFTPKDSFLTSVWLELLEVLEEAREAGERLPRDLSIYDLVISSDINEDDRDDLSISVQSPGWFRIRSQGPAPLASLSLYALAIAGVPYQQAVQAQVVAKVVRQANDSCMEDVDSAVSDYIKNLGSKRWTQACRLAKQADAEAKLKVGAKVAETKSLRKGN